jgi:hypothetical protein
LSIIAPHQDPSIPIDVQRSSDSRVCSVLLPVYASFFVGAACPRISEISRDTSIQPCSRFLHREEAARARELREIQQSPGLSA